MSIFFRRSRLKTSFAVWLLALLLIHSGPPSAAANPAPAPGPDYAAAMRPEFVGDIAAHGERPRYALQLQIDPAARLLTGTQQIVFTNTTSVDLTEVALRLYPNFPRNVFSSGGNTRMDVTGAAIAGQPVTPQYAASDTAVLLPFAPPLAPGAATTIAVSFTATIKPAVDGSFPLPSYYPMLAVHDGDGWRLDVTTFADHVYAESAFYSAAITLPANLTLAATGSTIGTQPEPGGKMTHYVVSGPVREWALIVGNFAVAQDKADDITVNVYTARGSHLDGRQIARVAAAALAAYNRRFGPYPYRELDIHLRPGRFDGGSEYPGLILLTSDRQVDAITRYVTAHEVAHQWWYGVVGNDIYRQPWLDEAFAQYSGIIYAEDVAGAKVAQADWEREVAQRHARARAAGDLPVGRAITGYPSFAVYYNTVYGKGATFLATLRQELGDERFFAGLQHYYQRHRYSVATTADVQRAFEETSERDLAVLFNRWVGP